MSSEKIKYANLPKNASKAKGGSFVFSIIAPNNHLYYLGFGLGYVLLIGTPVCRLINRMTWSCIADLKSL